MQRESRTSTIFSTLGGSASTPRIHLSPLTFPSLILDMTTFTLTRIIYIILLHAVGLSAVNLTGGTIVTKKMLDMFRRKDDAPEFNEYYLLPGAVAGIIIAYRYFKDTNFD